MADQLHIGNRWLGHSGLDMYDNTARLHDPLLIRYASPDPLYGKNPDTSPWTHCAANPLNAIDPLGEEWEADTCRSENGTLQVNLRVTGAVWNLSNSKFDMGKVATAINKQLNSIFTFTCEDENGNPVSVSMNSQIRSINSIFGLKSKDHLFMIINQNQFRNSNVPADSQNLLVRLSNRLVFETLSSKNIATIAHELGHTGGLKHPNEFPIDGVTDLSHNLMVQSKVLQEQYNTNRNSSIQLEWPQIRSILNNINDPSFKMSIPLQPFFKSWMNAVKR